MAFQHPLILMIVDVHIDETNCCVFPHSVTSTGNQVITRLHGKIVADTVKVICDMGTGCDPLMLIKKQ